MPVAVVDDSFRCGVSSTKKPQQNNKAMTTESVEFEWWLQWSPFERGEMDDWHDGMGDDVCFCALLAAVVDRANKVPSVLMLKRHDVRSLPKQQSSLQWPARQTQQWTTHVETRDDAGAPSLLHLRCSTGGTKELAMNQV
jgi:hypothetical protein